MTTPSAPLSRSTPRSRLPDGGPHDPGPGSPDPDGRALAVAYAFINARERTIAEVRTRLERAALPAREIEAAIAELVDFGYLDDARYARVFAYDKRALESWGADRITRALASRGVERELIAAALDDPGGDADQARAVELLQRRFASPPADQRACERALGVLIRKGYTSEVAYEAVRAWAGAGALDG